MIPLHFFVRTIVDGDDPPASVRGPYELVRVQRMLEAGELTDAEQLCLGGGTVWATAAAWEPLGLQASRPERHHPERLDLPYALAGISAREHDLLRWWVKASGRVRGPLNGQELRAKHRDRSLSGSMAALVGGECWVPSSVLEGHLNDAQGGPLRGGSTPPDDDDQSWQPAALLEAPTVPCNVCLELIAADCELCPECDEDPVASTRPPSSVRPQSIPDDPPGASWLRMHWRPLITMTAIGSLIGAGITLRYLAPERYQPPQRIHAPAAVAEPVCDTPCWHGEACAQGKCVWQPPNDVGHLPATPTIAGPFQLPEDMVDVLPLDAERYATTHLLGVQISDARTGAILTLVSDAPHAQHLIRVGEVFYATAPRRMYVIDAASTRVLKTVEIGGSIGHLTLGAGGRRVLASIPGSRAVAVIATDFHAEVARFFFGEDQVGPVAMDDTGEHALTTNGSLPLPGLRTTHHADLMGAIYAFDPSRLPSNQDRVRTGMGGNPAGILMLPNAKSSYVVLREKSVIVSLEHLPTGTIRQGERIVTCRQPEQIELVRPARRAIVRCNTGHAVDIISLQTHRRVRTIALNARVSDMLVTPDGRQALLVLPRDGQGAIGMLDLHSFELTLHELHAEPHRVRIARDGRTALVISDRSKVAWVIR